MSAVFADDLKVSVLSGVAGFGLVVCLRSDMVTIIEVTIKLRTLGTIVTDSMIPLEIPNTRNAHQ